MNEQDKAAYESFFDSMGHGGTASLEAWIACCEYKDKQAALAHRDAQPAVAHPPADVVQALVLASVQVAKVYRAMRKTLAEKYPQDGWSAEAMTLDTFDAALNKAKEHGL